MIKIKEEYFPTLSDIEEKLSDENYGKRNFVNNNHGIFLVVESAKAFTRNGKEYYNLKIRDGKMIINAKSWNWMEEPYAGGVIVAEYGVDKKWGYDINIRSIKKYSEIVKEIPEICSLMPVFDKRKEYEKKLIEYIKSMKNEKIKELLEKIFIDEKTRLLSYFLAPAATRNHHVRIGGLLQHSLNIVMICDQISKIKIFENLDRDVLIASALLHDIGKIKSYDLEDASFQITIDGALEDHIGIGVQILNDYFAMIKDFPQSIKSQIMHVVLSHHGLKEWGSVVQPKTLEAIIIHNIDRLEAQAESYIDYWKNNGYKEISEYIPMLGTRTVNMNDDIY